MGPLWLWKRSFHLTYIGRRHFLKSAKPETEHEQSGKFDFALCEYIVGQSLWITLNLRITGELRFLLLPRNTLHAPTLPLDSFISVLLEASCPVYYLINIFDVHLLITPLPLHTLRKKMPPCPLYNYPNRCNRSAFNTTPLSEWQGHISWVPGHTIP